MYQITEINIHKGVETVLCTGIQNQAIATTMARLMTHEFNKHGVRYKYIVQEMVGKPGWKQLQIDTLSQKEKK